MRKKSSLLSYAMLMIVGCLHAAESEPSMNESDEQEVTLAHDHDDLSAAAQEHQDLVPEMDHDAFMHMDSHDEPSRAPQPHDNELHDMLGSLEQGSQPHQFSPDQAPMQHNDESQQSTTSDMEIEEPFIEGIDTVDLDQPQGNWLFKRIWWEKAEARYEKIKKNIEDIFEHRMIFFTKRSELDKNILDPFYLKIGMGQGEFQAILTELLANIQKEQDKKGFLTLPEREIVTRLTAERSSLEQLSVALQTIGQLEAQIDASLNQLLEQINAIRGYDRQAWDAFKEIARVVDDQQARQLYYTVETASRNIKDSGYYLENSFSAHFDELVSSVKEQTDRVLATVAALKEKGIDFKKEVEMLTAPKPAPVKKEMDEQEEEEPEEQGFFTSYIISPLSAAWNGVVSVVTWPYHALFGSNDEEEEEDEA